jgi:hypothetical protein
VRLCCWLDTKQRMNTMTLLRNSRPSVTFMESPDGDSALPVDQSGYTAQRSAEDVLQVLDALKLDHPVLAPAIHSADKTYSPSGQNIPRLSLA